jgi:hypothetical protein
LLQLNYKIRIYPLKKILFLLYLLLIATLIGCASTRLGGKTIQETFSSVSVVNFIDAVNGSNYIEADRLVTAGVDVNAIGQGGISPLLWIMTTSLDTTKIAYLLHVGANPNYRDAASGASAMYLAAGGNRLDILEVLLKNGGNPDLLGPRDESLLMVAASQFRKNNIDLMLRYGADINLHDMYNETVANKAAAYGRFDWVANFLDSGLNYNLQDLAKTVEIRQVPATSEQQGWKNKVIDMLKTRGVKFPAFIPCYPPEDPRRKEENCSRFRSKPAVEVGTNP